MATDFVRDKGYLTLGTRLKRLGETLQAGVQQFLDAEGVPIQAGQFSILAAIDENGPLTVGELVEAIGVSQPGITRSIGQLEKKGILKTGRGSADQRTKVVELTAKGRALVEIGKERLWPEISAPLQAICGSGPEGLLNELGLLEDALMDKPLFQRIIETREDAQHD